MTVTSDEAMVIEGSAEDAVPPPQKLPRLLAHIRADGRPVSLDDHRTVYPEPAPLGRASASAFVDEIDRAGLLGRGGGAFPTARKLRAVALGRRNPVVVINGAEGEPVSIKDRWLLAAAPHLVLDGASLAAAAVGATDVFVCVDRQHREVLRIVEAAVAERLVREHGPAVRVLGTPSRYVAGEESALVQWLNGGPAKPTVIPPRPSERGVDGRPTLVDNVETLAHLAQIAAWGAEWFRQLGTRREPGTVLVTLSGAVSRRGVCEVAFGSPLGDVIASAGGDLDRLDGVLVGGCFGGWLTADEARRVTFCDDDLRRFGASVGCSAVVVLPRAACGWCETTRMLMYLASESAQQCGPCVNGLAAIARAASDISTGAATADTVRWINRWAGQVEGRGACSMPDGAMRLVRSALRVFARDVDAHLNGRGCARRDSAGTVVRLPAIQGSGWR